MHACDNYVYKVSTSFLYPLMQLFQLFQPMFHFSHSLYHHLQLLLEIITIRFINTLKMSFGHILRNKQAQQQ